MASLTTLLLSSGIPSSEKPTAPASKSALKSVKSFPLKFLVMVATVLTLIFSLAAEWRTSCKVSTSEMVGLVLAIITTVVKPPAAAARAPVWMSSLWVWPGSRKWTWISTKPGATTRPLASISSAPSSLISGAILTIFPSWTKTSHTWSKPDLGSITRPFLISSICFLLYS